MFIDTHTHLYCEEFDNDREEVVQRALAADVSLMLLPAIDSLSADRLQSLYQSHPDCFRPMAGLHPTSVADSYEEELALVERQLQSNPAQYVAVGEIGLDFYWDTTYRSQQEEALHRQLDLAETYQKPVALHIRNAYEEFFLLLQKRNRTTCNGVLHCYSGSLPQALQAVEMGFYFGIGGVLTYKKSNLPEIVASLPLERILLETDSPYLAPVPHRGRRNESAYLPHVAHLLADIKHLPVEHIAEVTTANAVRLFNL